MTRKPKRLRLLRSGLTRTEIGARYERRRDYLFVLAGTCLMALSANLCFTPAKMVPGGFTGLAIIMKYASAPLIPAWAPESFAEGLPTWFSNVLLNIPLILAAIRVRGWKFMRRTFAASVIFSLWLLVLPEYPLMGDDLFLTSVVGGALMGAGLGLVFLGKATTGGTDTLGALLLRLFPHLSTARLMQVLDAAVILLSVGIFGTRISLYAVISVVLTSRVADRITSGFRNAYSAFIVSSRHQKIADAVMKDLGRGVTSLSGTGMYTGKERPVLLAAVSRKQAVILKELVAGIDPDAFMILTDAREIRGEGFLGYSREEL
jgi:uncharacterized membrane-anchored protein YitT (DUF2179 family)